MTLKHSTSIKVSQSSLRCRMVICHIEPLLCMLIESNAQLSSLHVFGILSDLSWRFKVIQDSWVVRIFPDHWIVTVSLGGILAEGKPNIIL